MTLLTPQLKEGVEKLHNRLSSLKEPGKTIGSPTATARLTGPQTSIGTEDGFSILSDEPKWIGGNETGPYPSTHFVASIGFAENVIFARQAALHNVDFESYETSVKGNWDMKGMFEIDDTDPAFQEISIETRVTTNVPPSRIAELVQLTHRRCPMTATVSKAVKITRRLFVNGNEVPVNIN